MKEQHPTEPQKSETVEPKTLYISKRILRYESVIFYIQNITRVGMDKKKKDEKPIPISLILFSSILGMFLIFSSGKLVKFLGVGAIFIGVIGTIDRIQREDKDYILFIEFNSGRTASFIGKDKPLVEDTLSKISEVMEKPESNIEYKVNWLS
jgi:Family of unknown function (DUF6232)